MTLLLGALLALAFVLPAFAQSTTVPVAGLYDLIASFLLPIVSVLVAAIGGYLANLLRIKFGLQIEEQHRNAFQTALTNAAGLAIAKGKDIAAGKSVDVKNPAIADAVNYVIAAAPDALKYFGITPAAIAEKVTAKIGAMK